MSHLLFSDFDSRQYVFIALEKSEVVYPKDLTWPRLGEYSRKEEPLLLPIGSVEGHGAHLPISTDSLIAVHVSDELAERNDWISLPPVTYSIAVPSRIGNVGISQETLRGYVQETIQHFVDFGQKRFILILGHGGPDMKSTISAACESLCRNHRISILAFHILRVLEDLGLVDQAIDRHAGEWETSLMLLIRREIVGDVDSYSGSVDVRKQGVVGNPEKGSRVKGKRYLSCLLKAMEEGIGVPRSVGFCCNWE